MGQQQVGTEALLAGVLKQGPWATGWDPGMGPGGGVGELSFAPSGRKAEAF